MSSKKRLNDLRVIDLRAELEKRNLDKSGVRGVLIQRLLEHLEEEGHDPETYTFDLADTKTPSKRSRRVESAVEQEPEETPAMEDMIVQDDAGEDEENEQPADNSAAEQSETMEVDESEKVNRKRDANDEPEASSPKKPCLDKDDDNKENNLDTEDSINLDIGEDELLNDETDQTTKQSKQDDAACEEAAQEPEDSADAEPAADAAPETEANEEAATSNEAESNEKEVKDENNKDGDSEKKEKKDEGKEGGARNLWVSGLSGDTRAKDLKQLCSKHGKVIGAKVVTNARTPGSRCYGYVTMASPQDAENCIKNLHRTELHGRMISVEKAKSESESSSRRQPSRTERTRDANDDSKDGKEADKDGDKKEDASGAESTRSTSRTREKSARSDKDRGRRSSRSRERKRSPREVLSFNKIWKERDVARARERSRLAREEERRRRAAEEAMRERERRQRQEKHRLALEREKLRQEREKIEREKNELLRLERERHRLEREKLELERLELKRAQLRLEEERRKRGYESSSSYRKGSPPADAAYERDHRAKRHAPPPPPMSSRGATFEAPPPPRFDAPYDRGDKRPADRDRDYKRDYPPRHLPSNIKYSSNGAGDDARQPMPPGTRPKEPSSRGYEGRESRGYRPSPPLKSEPRPAWPPAQRYADAAPPAKGASGGESWSSGGGAEGRYGGYEARYSQYQPPPPGAPYPDRYQPPQTAREYARKY